MRAQDRKKIKKALESMLFVWGRPLDTRMAAQALEITAREAHLCLDELAEEYLQRDGGIQLRKINDKYQFCTSSDTEEYISRLCTPVMKKKLSNAAMEVLAIISYKQPVTRSEIEFIRGIKCDKVIEGLVKRELIEVKGHGEGIGHPMLFGTTELFLEKFGISGLDELPVIEDIEDISRELSEAELQADSGEPSQY